MGKLGVFGRREPRGSLKGPPGRPRVEEDALDREHPFPEELLPLEEVEDWELGDEALGALPGGDEGEQDILFFERPDALEALAGALEGERDDVYDWGESAARNLAPTALRVAAGALQKLVALLAGQIITTPYGPGRVCEELGDCLDHGALQAFVWDGQMILSTPQWLSECEPATAEDRAEWAELNRDEEEGDAEGEADAPPPSPPTQLDFKAWRAQALAALDLKRVYGDLLIGSSVSGVPHALAARDPSAAGFDAVGALVFSQAPEPGTIHLFRSRTTLSVFDYLVMAGKAKDLPEALRLVGELSGVPCPSWEGFDGESL